jgi:hypothetical protein
MSPYFALRIKTGLVKSEAYSQPVGIANDPD